MSRQRTYGRRDEAPVTAGDSGWRGVNMRLGPAQLEPGWASEAENMRFRRGVAETRRGVAKLHLTGRWMFRWGNAWPMAFNSLAPLGAVQGLGEFADPTGERWMVAAAGGKVWRTREGHPAAEVPCEVVLEGLVRFEQCFNVLLMFRRDGLGPLVLTDWTAGFRVPRVPVIEGTLALPAAESGLFFQNRVLVPYERDLVAWSDLGDYLRYSPATGPWRINEGSADRLVGLAAFGRTSVVVFKENSVFMLTGLSADASGAMTGAGCETVTEEYGCVSLETVARVGADLFWLSERGVVSLKQTALNEAQAQGLPVSEPVQPVIDRINWRFASVARAAYWDNFYYLAIPIDGSEVNNAVLVYDALNQAWAGLDTGDAMGVAAYAKCQWGGRERLFFLDHAGYVNLVDEGMEDEVERATTPYTEVTVVAQPTHGDIVRINGGTLEGGRTILADSQTYSNGYASGMGAWGVANHLWEDPWPWDWSETRAKNNWFDGWLEPWWEAPPGVTVELGLDAVFFFGGATPVSVEQIQAEGGQASFLEVFQVGVRDIAATGIASRLLTRGYASPDGERKRWQVAALQLGSWKPTLSIGTRTDGVEETETWVANLTRSATVYERPFGRAAWVPSNANDDHATPYREDYAVTVPRDTGLYLGAAGLELERMAEWNKRVRLHAEGMYVQVEVTGTEGHWALRQCVVEGVAETRRMGSVN